MHLTSLEIHNYIGIGDAKIDFGDVNGFTLIEGVNEDSPSASSNGAGKSCIFEAIYWCLFGKTKRGLTGDDVVNKVAGKNCSVELKFEVGSKPYIVYRSRKENSLEVHQGAIRNVGSVNLTLGTSKDTQEFIESLINMSELTFSKIAHFGQGDVKDFASLTDAELKMVFEQALGLTFLSDNLKSVKLQLVAVRESRSKLNLELEKLSNESRFESERVSTITEVIKNIKESNYQRLKECKQDIEDVVSQMEKAEDDIRASKHRIASILPSEEKIASLKAAISRKTEATNDYDAARISHKMNCNELDRNRSKLEDLLRQLNDAKNIVGTKCGECGKEYTQHDVSSAVGILAQKLREKKDDVDSITVLVGKSGEDERSAYNILTDINSKVEEFNSIKESIAEINSLKSVILSLEDSLRSLENRKNVLLGKQESILSDKSCDSHAATIDAAKHRLDAIVGSIGKIHAEIVDIDEEIEELTMLEEILGNGGLKSYIFDNITPELNRIVSEYLNMLNPDISVEISTMTKLKSGEYRDKFSINVTTRMGASEYKGNSGGERQFVNLAIALAFNRICRSISAGHVNVLFLDEPFESLDDSAAERAVELCKTFAGDVDCTFIISHNPAVKDIVSGKVKVIKNGGRATIEI